MRNIGMALSYDGTNYCGFQTQPRLNTVQDQLESAIHRLTGEQVKVISSGRTDAGVHARRQFINFYTLSVIPIERWCLALNTVLPKDIVTLEAMELPLDFHSRKSAKRKTYRYTIYCGKFPDVFHSKYQIHHPRPLNVQEMQKGIAYLIGEHDFTSFCTPKTDKEIKVRTIYKAEIVEEAKDILHIYMTGNGFLYNMVRIIAGTLIQVGEGKRKGEDIRTILLSKDRNKAGPKAQAHGLMLWDVIY